MITEHLCRGVVRLKTQPKVASHEERCPKQAHASGVLGFSFACGRRPHAKLNRRTERSYIDIHFAFRFLPVHGRLSVELYSLLGCCVFSRQLHMHFAFRILSVPSRLTAELYSLLGFCVFLRHIDTHFAFSVLPDSCAFCV